MGKSGVSTSASGNRKLMINDNSLMCTVVLGPRKCGTTTLYSLLSQIPGLAIPGPTKEVHLFDNGPISLCEFRELGRYNLTSRTSAFIDVATHYFSKPELWQNILETSEVNQVALIVRDPIERFISHCLHQMRTKNEWTLDVDTIAKRYPEVVSDSLYSERLPYIREAFGEENVVLINFEDLKSAPRDVAVRVCASVGVEVQKDQLIVVPGPQNQGLKPEFPSLYKLLRTSGNSLRSVLGGKFTEIIKKGFVNYWPVAELDSSRTTLERQLRNHQLGERLIEEREYTIRLLDA